MRSGTLRHKIYLQAQTDTSDGMGSFTVTWTDVYSCRASIWTLNARERLDSMKLEVSADHRIRIRHPKAILEVTEKHRVKWLDPATGTTKYFNIISIINPDRRNKMLEMIVNEET